MTHRDSLPIWVALCCVGAILGLAQAQPYPPPNSLPLIPPATGQGGCSRPGVENTQYGSCADANSYSSRCSLATCVPGFFTGWDGADTANPRTADMVCFLYRGGTVGADGRCVGGELLEMTTHKNVPVYDCKNIECDDSVSCSDC